MIAIVFKANYAPRRDFLMSPRPRPQDLTTIQSKQPSVETAQPLELLGRVRCGIGPHQNATHMLMRYALGLFLCMVYD